MKVSGLHQKMRLNKKLKEMKVDNFGTLVNIGENEVQAY